MKNKPKYWPGSNIIKSTNNDFNWRKRVPTVAKAIVEYQTKSRSGKREIAYDTIDTRSGAIGSRARNGFVV